MKADTWFVYIIQSEKGKLYTGITTDVQRRFEQHQTGKGGAKYFRTDPPVQIVHIEEVQNRSEASKREAAIKKMSRHQKDLLIAKI